MWQTQQRYCVEPDYFTATNAMYAAMREKPFPRWFGRFTSDMAANAIRFDSPHLTTWIYSDGKTACSGLNIDDANHAVSRGVWTELTPSEGRAAEAIAKGRTVTLQEAKAKSMEILATAEARRAEVPAHRADFEAWWNRLSCNDRGEPKIDVARMAWHAALATVAPPKLLRGFADWWYTQDRTSAEKSVAYDISERAYAAGAASTLNDTVCKDPTLTPLRVLAEAGYYYWRNMHCNEYIWCGPNHFMNIIPAGPDAFDRCHRAMSDHYQKRGEK